MSDTANDAPARAYVPWLWLLTGLFCVRVIAQLSTLFLDIAWVPPFACWHGGALPYGLLLACQIVIVAVLTGTALAFSSGNVMPVHRLGVALLLVGTAYFGFMCARLILGLTVLDDHRWFGSHIPTLFHLVLATFVLLLGKFHRTRIKEC